MCRSWLWLRWFVDDGSELWVAVEGGAAEAGVFGDGGEGDLLAVVGEVGAGGFDGVEVGRSSGGSVR